MKQFYVIFQHRLESKEILGIYKLFGAQRNLFLSFPSNLETNIACKMDLDLFSAENNTKRDGGNQYFYCLTQ